MLADEYFEVYPNDINNEYVFNYDLLKNSFYLLSCSPHITTGIMGVRLAVSMGFTNLSIYGMDGSYINFIPESEKIEFEGKKILRIKETITNNPNYFFSYYQQIGDLYNIPNMNNIYTCKCNYHNNTKVTESLHEYVMDALLFDLKRVKLKHLYEKYDTCTKITLCD